MCLPYYLYSCSGNNDRDIEKWPANHADHFSVWNLEERKERR